MHEDTIHTGVPMFLDFMSEVEGLLHAALESCGYNVEEGVNSLGLDVSPHADLASSVAFRLAPLQKKSPMAIAKVIHQAIPQNYNYIDRVELSGPYLNFFMNQKFLNYVLGQALADNAWTGRMKEKVIVEHTSANPDGPLHVGHIRNSVIGDTLVRILRRAGCTVDAQYYVNDMGRQEAMVVVGCDHFQLDASKADHAVAKVYIAANRLMETNPEIRNEADQVIQRYEAGDEETAAKIRSVVTFAIGGIEETLHRMNICHDSYHWESEFVRKGDVAEIVGLLEKTGLTEWEDGAFQLDLNQYGFEKKMVMKRANGTSLYITRDLAYHRCKSQNSDRSVDILGADHKLVSGQLRTALRLLGIREPEVVIFEFVSLPTGSMSTRKGKFISADELLDEVESRSYEEVKLRRPEESEAFLKEVAAKVAAGAVRYDVVKVSPDKATTFDWKQALDFEKLSAPFIQYSHARACSILRKGETEVEANVGAEGMVNESIKEEAGQENALSADLLSGENEIALIKKIAQFDLVIDRAARELKPHQLATYARELAESFNLFYRYSPVLDAQPHLRRARMTLARAAKNALRATLETLGIQALETM
jgi:arginyl-tRNA synthetase